MSIPVTCPECQSHFHVGDEFAGLTGRCPDCTAVIDVPDPDAPPDDGPVLEPLSPWAPRGADTFPPAPVSPVPRREERRDGPLRAAANSRPRRPRFDPHDRAERWARVHRGLGYLQVAVVLGFVSQILQTILMVARGGVPENPNGMIDSGQLALGFGMLLMMLAAGMFWVLGRAAGLRVPYVPARNCARAGFIMALASIAGLLITFCFFVAAIGAIAQAGANGGPPTPEALMFTLLLMGSMFATAGLIAGAEVAGLMALGRIGDALRDRAAAGWARRSIVVMFITGGLILFGLCGVSVYAAEQQKQREKAQAGAVGPAGDKAKGVDKGKANDKAKGNAKDAAATKDRAKGENGKDADPDPPAAGGAGPNPPPEPIDATLALILDLVFFIPLLVFLIHYSVALQAGRRAIRREIDVLTGRDHGEHDRHF